MADQTNTVAQTSEGEGVNTAAAEGTQTASVTAGATDTPPAEKVLSLTQSQLDKMITDRLAEAKRRSDAQIKAAADKAEADKAAAQGEYKKAAELAQARVAELEPLSERITKLEGILSAQLAARVKGLSAEAKKAVDSLPESMGIVERLEWLTANEALFSKPAPPNVNARDGQAGSEPTDPKAKEAELRSRFRF